MLLLRYLHNISKTYLTLVSPDHFRRKLLLANNLYCFLVNFVLTRNQFPLKSKSDYVQALPLVDFSVRGDNNEKIFTLKLSTHLETVIFLSAKILSLFYVNNADFVPIYNAYSIHGYTMYIVSAALNTHIHFHRQVYNRRRWY